MKILLIILILLLPVFLQAMPYASAHGVCGGLQPRYVHLEHTTLSKQTLQTGENFTITGNMTALTGNDLKGKLFLQTKPSPHGRLVVSSIEPSSGLFDISGNSTIPYSITVTALLPGNYFVSSGLDLIGIGPSLLNNGCSNTIEPNLTVTGSPICIQGLVAVTKAEDDSPACVKPNTAQILIERGWATNVPQLNHMTGAKANDPFGITALVIYHPQIVCLTPPSHSVPADMPSCPPNNFYLKINSNSTAYLLGYNICDDNSCAKNNNLSILLPINTPLYPNYQSIGLPMNLQWKYDDTVNIQLEVSPNADNKTASLIDLGNSTIVP